MRRLSSCLVLLGIALPVAAEMPAKLVEEHWDAAYLDGARMGHQHTAIVAVERDGKKIFRTTKTLHLTIKRYTSVVNQKVAMSSEETADGQMVALSMTQYLDKGEITLSGTVDGDRLIVRTPSNPDGSAVPWDSTALGLYRQERFFRDRKIKPGDTFRFLDYPPALMRGVKMNVAVKEPEEIDVLVVKGEGADVKAERGKKKLLRAEATPEKVRIGDRLVPLPRLVLWLDEERRTVRQQMEMPGMGRLTLYRTTKPIAVGEAAAPALLPDLGLNALVSLDRAIERPHEAEEIVYRITVKDDDDPASTFVSDARQRVENLKGNTFELHVRPIREPRDGLDSGPVKEEYLKSSYFLDSRDETIRKIAQRVVGEETDAWRKAQLLEKWAHDKMSGSTSVGFATASQVARDLKGDCRQHAMLLAALCRAVEVPSRTAVGLVYFTDPDKGPMLAFHMWTEVWVKGQWLMLDATLGQGSVGAAHLKVADHSWHDTQTLAPLLPVTRVLGQIKVEVVSVK
jgi:hypothetical protein